MPCFLCLLLSLQGAWAAVIIQVPSSPVQAGPHSTAYLPCYFTFDPPRTIDNKILSVRWSLKGRTVTSWSHGNTNTFRLKGAVFDVHGVRKGNATIKLRDVMGEDVGEYTCSVSHPPDTAEGKVELKLEVPPRSTLGPTEVRLGKPSNLTCAASDFYPDRVSVKWLRGSETLKVDSPPAQPRSNYLFYAESVLNFIPQISDDGVTFSCHIQHQAAKDPIPQDIKLKVVAPPRLTLGSTEVPLGKPSNLTCAASDFYPDGVSVKWLRGSETLKDDLPPGKRGPNYLFYAESVLEFTPQISDIGVTFSCRIQHRAVKDPISQDFELDVVAPPRLTLGSTEVPLGKPSNLTCAASDFYPDGVSVKWLRGSETLKADLPPGKRGPNYLFYAESVLNFIPQISDAGVTFSCRIQHQAAKDPISQSFELKVVAPPRLTLGLTDVELGEPSNLMCTASDFYPGNVSVKWLRGNETLKVDSPPVQHGPNYLFYAESVLEFTPQVSDAGVTFSCHIHHRAAKDPITQNFELKVQARPELYMVSRPPGKTFLVAECLVCGFYPQNVTVQWLQNGKTIQGRIYKSELVQNPNGTFSTGSTFFPKQGHVAASYTCQVQHETLEAPLEETILWEPEAPGYFGSPMAWVLGSLGHLVGLGVGIGATLMYKRRRAKGEQAALNNETLRKISNARRENPDDVIGL